MTTIRLLILVTIVSFLAERSICAQAQPAPAPAPGASKPVTTSNPAAAPEPEKPSPEVLKIYREAAAEMQKKNYDGALAKLDEADKLSPNNPNILNLRGAIYTQQKNYPKALETFSKAGQTDKKSFSPRYNYCEVLFLQKKYPDALAQFQVLLNEDPKNSLVRYKVFLCHLAQDNQAEAKKILEKFDPFDELPVYYFSQAAWDFKYSNAKEANSWLISANKIYPPYKNALFSDALVELGWLPRGEVGTDKPAAK